jgi:hypothetical protein
MSVLYLSFLTLVRGLEHLKGTTEYSLLPHLREAGKVSLILHSSSSTERVGQGVNNERIRIRAKSARTRRPPRPPGECSRSSRSWGYTLSLSLSSHSLLLAAEPLLLLRRRIFHSCLVLLHVHPAETTTLNLNIRNHQRQIQFPLNPPPFPSTIQAKSF